MKDFKDIKLKITLRSIILFEKMVGHSFFDLREEETPQLIYCVVRANNKFNYAFNVFMGMLENKRFSETVITEFTNIFELMQQLMPKNIEQPKGGEQQEKKESVKVAVLTSRLIVNLGLDAHYVMDEMELWEMQDLFDAYEQKEQNRMEENRLWTYFTLLPNITKKNFKPSDMLQFPWEKTEQEKAAQSDFKRHEDIIRGVLGIRKKSAEKETLKEKE